MQRVPPGHSFFAWGRLRKVLKAGSGPDAPPSARLLRSSHSHTNSGTHTKTVSSFCDHVSLVLLVIQKGGKETNAPLTAGADIRETATVSHTDNCWSGTSWKDKMGVWTALILASQLLLNLSLHVEAQALGECYLKCFKKLFLSII